VSCNSCGNEARFEDWDGEEGPVEAVASRLSSEGKILVDDSGPSEPVLSYIPDNYVGENEAENRVIISYDSEEDNFTVYNSLDDEDYDFVKECKDIISAVLSKKKWLKGDYIPGEIYSHLIEGSY